MTEHRFHPDPARGDPPNAILYDDCPRCAEHAEDPRGLDADRLAAIVKICRTGESDHLMTDAELRAEGNVYRALCLVQRVTGLPWRTLVDAGMAVPS